MSKPFVVTISHHLGRDEAERRLKSGLGAARARFGQLLLVEDETWTDHQLQFRLTALAQSVIGTIAVFDDHVRLEVMLPWLLASLAEKIQPLIQREGTLLLDRK